TIWCKKAFAATSMCTRSCSRCTAIAVHREHDLVHIDVAANAFLHHMVRNIAGLLIEVGRGLRPPEAVRALLEGRDRRRNAPTADPEGLCLRRIEYPEAFHLPDPV
ncbi:MAG: tRNA pseudouridine(38-40) synthase TruA, partial [Gammaproteobacteria bacterium]